MAFDYELESPMRLFDVRGSDHKILCDILENYRIFWDFPFQEAKFRLSGCG